MRGRCLSIGSGRGTVRGTKLEIMTARTSTALRCYTQLVHDADDICNVHTIVGTIASLRDLDALHNVVRLEHDDAPQSERTLLILLSSVSSNPLEIKQCTRYPFIWHQSVFSPIHILHTPHAGRRYPRRIVPGIKRYVSLRELNTLRVRREGNFRVPLPRH